jgi:hypothetical protein
MAATSLVDHTRIIKHRAAGYTLRNSELVNIRRVIEAELPSYGGVFSTVKDLVTWDAALAAGKVVKPATLAQMWTPVRSNSGATYPYGFGWFVDARRAHRWIYHTGITGTELSNFPDDEITVVVLTNLGRTLEPGNRVNSWGLTYGVAGRYIKGLLVGREKPARQDPDPARTAALRDILHAYARGEEPLTVLPLTRTYFTPIGRTVMAERLKTLKEFSFVTCDEFGARQPERLGERIARVCHYRLVNADETRYFSFWLRGDGVVVDFWSSTE